MTRIKRGYIRRKRHQKKFKMVKGFRGHSSLLFKKSNQQYLKAYQNAFIDRRLRKRYFRSIWIRRINAKIRPFGFNYHSFASQNSGAKPQFNRKIWTQLILHDFSLLVVGGEAANPKGKFQS